MYIRNVLTKWHVSGHQEITSWYLDHHCVFLWCRTNLKIGSGVCVCQSECFVPSFLLFFLLTSASSTSSADPGRCSSANTNGAYHRCRVSRSPAARKSESVRYFRSCASARACSEFIGSPGTNGDAHAPRYLARWKGTCDATYAQLRPSVVIIIHLVPAVNVAFGEQFAEMDSVNTLFCAEG